MKKTFFRKSASGVVTTAIMALLPTGVSAEWRLNYDKTWSYTEENTTAKGWKNISNEWYYFNSSGRMKTGWLSDNGVWYYLNNTGAMQDGWDKINGNWYYFDDSGAMKTGWVKDNGKWYYLDYSEGMQTGSVNINGKSYHFSESGALQGVINSNSKPSTAVNAVADVGGLPKLPQNYSINILASTEGKILELMNQKRAEAGLSSLTMDNTLLEVARYKSNHMIQYNYFDHTTPSGENWTNWLKTIGYKYTTTGENIAYNNYDPVELFNQWWNSPGHKANMMKSSYNKVGIGVIDGNGKYMGTQEFSN